MSDQPAPSPQFTRTLAAWAVTLGDDDVPEEILTSTRLLALDGLGCALFGSTLPWAKLAADHAVAAGGPGDIAVWGTGRRVSLAQAPLANGTAVHGFEFDDVHPAGVVHAGSQVLPVAVAVAQHRAAQGDPPSDRELVVALVVAYEIAARIGVATGAGQLARGFHPSPNTGAFASAVAAGRLLGLDAVQLEHALGIAGSFGGYLMAAQYGAMLKRLHAGHSAMNGLTAALWASRGITGTRHVLEAPYGGFATTHVDAGQADLPAAIDGLGDRWEIPSYTIKAYPCCGSNHTALDAWQALRARQPELRSDTVDAVEVRCSTLTLHHVGWPYVPDGVTAAQMNLAYCLAACAVHGELTVDQFEPDRLADPGVLAMAARVRLVADPAIDDLGPRARHTVRVTVTTVDGHSDSEYVEHPRGSALRPLSPNEIVAKYRSQAARVLSPDAVDALSGLVLGLGEPDSAGDTVARIGALLAVP